MKQMFVDIEHKIDVETLSPKLDFRKKICNHMDLKLVRIGKTNRSIEKGFYLLPKKNEKKFLAYNTWIYAYPGHFLLNNGICSNFFASCEEELFYCKFLDVHSFNVMVNDREIFIENPLYRKSYEEAEIWLDLNGR